MGYKMIIALAVILCFISTAKAGDESQEAPFHKQTFVYKTVDSCDIHVDVYQPDGDAVRPAILYIHGGALMMGHREQISSVQLEQYVKQGNVLFSIDYRLAPESLLPAIAEDLKDAWQWIRSNAPEKFHVDPNRIAVIGHSAGGYLALLSGFTLNPRPTVLVSFYGYGDIIGDWYSRPDPHYLQSPHVVREDAMKAIVDQPISESRSRDRFTYYLYLRQQGLWPNQVSGHDPLKEPDWFIPYMPLRNVDAHYPPTLLLHGEKDTDVPFALSSLMAEELQKHGVEHQFISNPDWNHGFDGKMKEPAVAAAFEQVLVFLCNHLQAP